MSIVACEHEFAEKKKCEHAFAEKKNVIGDDHDADNAVNVDDGGELDQYDDDDVVWQPADTHVDATDEHHGAGKEAPKKKVEFCSLGLVGKEYISKSCIYMYIIIPGNL